MTLPKAILISELKEVMRDTRARWLEMGLDIKVFFDEVLMNIKEMPQWVGELK